jgi:ABC-type dipeptide/oligopeptide/nickel transport system permease component
LVSKDQAIGGVIFLVCIIIAIGYTAGLFYFGYFLQDKSSWPIAQWLIAIPVFLAFVLILGIGAWIGWTMATTPPPKPIEELETEKEEKKEERKEE